MRLFAFVMLACFAALVSSCRDPEQADAVYFNGKVYTVDSAFTCVEAFAVKDGRIVATGTNAELQKWKSYARVDLKGAAVYPGLQDAHCHFYGYAIDLGKIWLIGTKSFAEIIDILSTRKEDRFMGWVFGRGWDQNDWADKSYPDRAALDSLFPDVPVFLMRIDGHAALVNGKALELAGVNAETKILAGEVVKVNGRLTGLLIDNAVDLVKAKIPEPDPAYTRAMLKKAEANCFEVGLTTVADAGLDYRTILLLDSLQKKELMQMRIYAMALYNDENVNYFAKNGAMKSDRMQVRSFKIYGDGSLGSRGACLKAPYSDQNGHFGSLLHARDSFPFFARKAAELGFQLNVHCIGDSTNGYVLNTYAAVLKGKNDLRWRIEHAQVVEPKDRHIFGDFSIIPSVQPTHATSDMYWAEERLGKERIAFGYAYRDLLKQNGMLAAGSDFPVEGINPLDGFYAAVLRQDHKGFPPSGFQKEQALTRQEALRAMTCWAAYSNFWEKEMGSIEVGKWADFVILSDDLMLIPDAALGQVKVKATYVAGKKVFPLN